MKTKVMTSEELIADLDGPDIKGDRVRQSYVDNGSCTSLVEAWELHQACSPWKIPECLTKRQVRRRISKFRKHGNVNQSPLHAYRIDVFVNGKMMMGTSIIGEPPTTGVELHKAMRMVTSMLKQTHDPLKNL